MFDVDSRPLQTSVRCRECRAALDINTDSDRLARKALKDFQKSHLCGGRHAAGGSSAPTGGKPGAPRPIRHDRDI